MPNILDEILAVKRREVAGLRPRLLDFQAACRDAPPPRDFAAAIRRHGGRGSAPPSLAREAVRIIAEVKHRSPSAGIIIEPFVPVDIARQYAAAGADAVLLIAEALESSAMADLAALAADLRMTVLAEAHSAAAVGKAIACGAACVGINNRDLATFKVDLATTERLAPIVRRAGRILVAESGVKTAADVRRLLAAGCNAILVGEGLLKSGRIAERLAELKNA